ncbi:arylmalonate decarboxylase [Salipiger abyssi]|uniref:maleate cis-trans isomerase family protein n=1 Tax=Salipiger abyssi TaxID=1250539 RepID=UPI000977A9AE|nr:arylmalonate decarboxylase [Salipiger abyssi]
MTDLLGWRRKFAVLIPSTNTIVQPEFDDMRVEGVTNHISRVAVPNATLKTDADMERFMGLIEDGTRAALDAALSCAPDHVIIGMSSETFWGGLAGSRVLAAQLAEWTDLPATMGSDAADAALRAYGARRLGILTPYLPVGDANVHRFFTDLGYDVAQIIGLKRSSPTDIAATTIAEMDAALDELGALDVDAILQCGTNLCMAAHAPRAEARLGKPVIAINTALYWHALRSSGIHDTHDRYGSLFLK